MLLVNTCLRNSPISFSAPSPVFSATLPVNPSVTTTSVVPAAMSWPSTKPWNCGPIWLARRISAASRTVSSPFSSSDPTFSRPMVGAVSPSTVRANTSPITANSTRLRTSHCTLAPRSSMTTSPRADGPIAGHGRAVDAGQRLDHDLRQRQQRAGVAGGHQPGSLAGGNRVNRQPHRRLPAAQRGGRLHVVGDHVRRMADGAGRPGALVPAQQGRQRGSFADQQEARRRMAFGRKFQALGQPCRGRCRPPWHPRPA